MLIPAHAHEEMWDIGVYSAGGPRPRRVSRGIFPLSAVLPKVPLDRPANPFFISAVWEHPRRRTTGSRLSSRAPQQGHPCRNGFLTVLTGTQRQTNLQPSNGRKRSMKANPIQLSTRHGKVYGMEYGRPGDSPVLALHGWQDNCATFSRLAPMLKDLHIVAIDLPGHGKSPWKSKASSFNSPWKVACERP